MGSKSKLWIYFPKQLWLGGISEKFPYFQFEIRAFVPVEHDPFLGNSLIAVIGHQPEQILPFIQTHTSLLSYSIMEQTDTSLVIATQTNDQFLLKAIVKNFILVDLPVKVSQGVAEFIINSSRENIDQFVSDLTGHGIRVDIKQIGTYNENLNELQLTPRQIEIYFKTREAGYYDSPRRITLTQLAEELGVAKSSLSSMLQRIHKKLLGEV